MIYYFPGTENIQKSLEVGKGGLIHEATHRQAISLMRAAHPDHAVVVKQEAIPGIV